VGFSLKPRPANANGSDFCLFAAPHGTAGGREDDGTVTGAAFTAVMLLSGEWSITAPGLPSALLRTITPPATGSHTLRIALAEGVAAASFDGLPGGFVPLRDASGRLSLYIRVNGCEATITSFNLSTHDPQPPAGWKALAPAPGLKAADKGASDF
jgi:hypothetical protein